MRYLPFEKKIEARFCKMTAVERKSYFGIFF